jgi:hypothetical protein
VRVVLFSDVGQQDGEIVLYYPGKLKKGEKCFSVRTTDSMEDDFSLQESRLEEGNDTQDDDKTRARVDMAQWEARWNLRKAFQTLTRTEDLSQDAGEQLQTKFPPRPHNVWDPVPPP